MILQIAKRRPNTALFHVSTSSIMNLKRSITPIWVWHFSQMALIWIWKIFKLQLDLAPTKIWNLFGRVFQKHTFQFKTDESYEVEVDFFTEDSGNAKPIFFNGQCQWNFIPQSKAVSYKGEKICLLWESIEWLNNNIIIFFELFSSFIHFWNLLGVKADANFAPRSFCFLEHFTFQLTLLLNTLYSLTHFIPQHTLHFSTLCSSAHFAPWNGLLTGTLYSLDHFALSVPGSKVCWGGKFTKVFQGAKCSKEQSVPGSKVCWESKY